MCLAFLHRPAYNLCNRRFSDGRPTLMRGASATADGTPIWLRLGLLSLCCSLAFAAFVVWYELLHDKSLKCSQYESHNAT